MGWDGVKVFLVLVVLHQKYPLYISSKPRVLEGNKLLQEGMLPPHFPQLQAKCTRLLGIGMLG